MTKHISQSIEVNSEDELNRRIGEAFVDALKHMVMQYDLHLSKGEKLVYPSSIDVDVVLQNLDLVVVLTEIMRPKPMPVEPSQGLYQKYKLEKTDGSPVSPDAQYLVLRVDTDMAAREAALCYASAIAYDMPELSKDIFAWVDQYTPREAGDVGLDGSSDQGGGETGKAA